MAKKKDIGTQFQEDVQSTLDTLKRTGRLRYTRLYDTKSARNRYMPPQPGDFIVASLGYGHLLECKASEVHDSLKDGLKQLVKSHQAAEARLWIRTGNPSWFLFYSQPKQTLEVWMGAEIGEAYVGQRKLQQPYLQVSSASLLELMQTLFIGPVEVVEA